MNSNTKNGTDVEESLNYYEQSIKNIDNFINEKEAKKALFLVEQELYAPYIPKEYESIFKNKLTEILTIINNDQNTKKNFFDPEQCFEILSSSRDILKPLALNELRNLNLRAYLINLQNLFKNENLFIQVKASIYEFCVEQEIDYVFEINNLKINPKIQGSVGEHQYFINNLKNIDSKAFKNPTLNKIAYEMMISYCANTFPESLFLENEDDSEEFISIANELLGLNHSSTKTKKYDKIYNKIFNSN